jgi:site-specific DNA-methyltransferase (adenine-specific)
VKPYYEDASCVIYHGDCREVLPALSVECAAVRLLLSDPPYGMFCVESRRNYAARSMGKLAQSNNYPRIVGDDAPFDPSHLLGFPQVVLFGANHYADKLPASPAWIVWDKTGCGRNVSDQSDAELAWVKEGGAVRTFSHMWKGMMKDSERDARRVHPTQKPVALMAWIISQMTQVGDVVLDPYMGSGPVLRAAKDLQRRAIGIEIVEEYCEIAAQRLSQETLELGA